LKTVNSIAFRITAMVIAIALMVLLFTCGALFWHQSWSIQNNLAHDLGVTTDIVSSSAAVATMFNDPERASQTLRALQAVDYVTEATIVRKDGSVLARYLAGFPVQPLPAAAALDDSPAPSGPPVPKTEPIFLLGRGSPPGHGINFEHDAVLINRPIIHAGERHGTLYISADFSSTYLGLLLVYTKTTGVILLVSVLAAYLLSRIAIRGVTAPILGLARTASLIANGADYSVRAGKAGKDEVGTLTEAFNQMLSQIELQDGELQSAQGVLRQQLAWLEAEIAGRKLALEEQAKLTAILDSTTDFVSRASVHGGVLYLNSSGRRMVGLPLDADVSSMVVADFHPEASVRIITQEAMPASIQQGSWKGEVLLRHVDGHGIPVSIVLICHFSPTHEVESYSAIMRDMTEEKAAAEVLRQSQLKLVESSRFAGKAEVATHVLHNVGNVLNSVNVSGNLLNERIRNSKLSALARVTALVSEHRESLPEFIASDPRGRRLPELLEGIQQALQTEQRELVGEVTSISGHIAHIREIVTLQQSHAQYGGLQQRISPAELMEEALSLHTDSFTRHGIALVKDFSPVPPLIVDKHKVLQILVNLLANARQALDDIEDRERCIILRVAQEDGERVVFSVQDNGIGIPPENLTRIFSHGFTTKKNGHGFGLHGGALDAQSMGGQLRVAAAPSGHGATFILELLLPEPAAALPS
jgi:PAS domain S-box-containing protein